MPAKLNIDIGAFLLKHQAKSSSTNAPYWSDIEKFYNKKLWYQLTLKLKEFIGMIPAEDLLDLYQNFIVDFQNRINELELSKLCVIIGNSIKDNGEAIKFFNEVFEQIKKCDLSKAMIMSSKAMIYLRAKEMEKCKELIDSANAIIDDMDGVSDVHCAFYKLSSSYYLMMAIYSDYYRHSLRYLGCVKLEDIPVSDQIDMAFNISLAAVLGKEIYNFGELLVHPILNCIRDGEKQWLVDLLYAYNSGDMKLFKELKFKWISQPDLKKNESDMERKMCLLCLMEMTFRRSTTDRSLSFKDIAQVTGLAENEVEMLVMRALSLGLVKGKLDEVNQCALMSWVQPRVLNKDQISTMQKKLNLWCKDVNKVEKLVMDQAADILT